MSLTLYKEPLSKRLVFWSKLFLKPLIKVAVLVAAVRGKYPWWMVTPDDRVPPFGCGTTPGASYERSQVRLYERFGRYVGDVVWLGWRNAGYGLSYWLKPDFLKRPGIRYMDLSVVDQRSPAVGWDAETGVELLPGVGTVYVSCPDGSWLWETTRKFGPLYVITGYRLSAIAAGRAEDRARIAAGMLPIPRPARHPNMDGRRILSFRTARTM